MSIIQSSFSTRLTGYRYVKWFISALKTNGTTVAQASEFILQLNGSDISMSGTTATNPNGTVAIGEEVTKLYDLDTATKWCDQAFTANNGSTAILDLGSIKFFNGYRWSTANDFEERDPKNWTISVSNDGTNWISAHSVANFTATSTRFANAGSWSYAY